MTRWLGMSAPIILAYTAISQHTASGKPALLAVPTGAHLPGHYLHLPEGGMLLC